MSEELFETAGIRVTATAVYGVFSVLVLILFMSLWLIGRKKRTRADIFAGQVMNGIGFGLLPALAILKAFQESWTGPGAEIAEPLPLIHWLSADGHFMPGRIEAAAAAAGFTVLCVWLILRRKEMPDNGDLLMTALCIWAVIRLVTEDFRSEPMELFRYTSCATVLCCAILWAVRRTKCIRMPARTIADITAVCICIAINLLTSAQIFSAGSGIADFSVKTGSAALMLILTLMIGGDLRRITEQDDQPVQAPTSVSGDTMTFNKV